MTDTDLGGRAEEREMLVHFLDWYRSVVERKAEGLSLEDAKRVMTPSGLSVLGVVAHLAAVEHGWFVETFSGVPVDPAWDDHADFILHADDSVESVVAEYRGSCDRARAIAGATPSLDGLSAAEDKYRGHVSLRWILVHMIDETARHAGHLDVMRELIDGQTGD
jgi:uncharacterized damage-inducible protein DinB